MKKHKMDFIGALVLTVGFTIGAASGVLVMYDDFSDDDTSPSWDGRLAITGQQWKVTNGEATKFGVSGGVADTGYGSGENGDMTIVFGSTLGAGQELIVDFTTALTAGNTTGGWAGINLFGGDVSNKRFFISSPNHGGWQGWGVEAWSGGEWYNSGGLMDEIADVHFRYEYDTGLYDLIVKTAGGTWSALGMSTGVGINFDTLQVLAGTGTNIALDNLKVQIIPEPGAIALAGLSLLGLLRRRRG